MSDTLCFIGDALPGFAASRVGTSTRRLLTVSLLSIAAMANSTGPIHGQEEDAPPPAAAAKPAEEPVTIKREPLTLIDARTYRVPLQLEPVRTLELVAPVDGVVRSVSTKSGAKVAKESSLLQLDETSANLRVKRAKANLLAAKIEKKAADASKEESRIELANARLEVAETDVAIEELALQSLSIRAKFAGEITRILVGEGDYVRAGETLAILIDSSKLIVELPVERESSKVGGSYKFKVEATDVEGKFSAIVPLAARFDPLREIAEGLASGVVELDNAGGKMFPGQGVFTTLIPAATVCEVPAAAVSNLPDGSRKLQVLRDNIVRTLPVTVHSRQGADRVFVSGPFRKGDELIASASKELVDGTPVRPAAAPLVGAAGQPGQPAAAPPKKPAAEDSF